METKPHSGGHAFNDKQRKQNRVGVYMLITEDYYRKKSTEDLLW